jgi:hypothetical protein
VRVHLIGTGDGEPEIGTGAAASQLLSWLTGEANLGLTVTKTRLWLPTAAEVLGTPAVSAAGVAASRTKIAVAWRAGRAGREAAR